MSDREPDAGSAARGNPVARLIHSEAFAPFLFRDFRLLWLMVFVRSAALWLETVGRPVLIVELTGSPFLLGVVLAAYMGPNLVLAPLTGVIIDRFPHKLVLLGAFAASVASSGTLFLLLLFDSAEGWHVIALAVFSGISSGIFSPGRRAMLPSIVDQEHYRSAVALSQTGQTSMRIGGALLAGVLLSVADFTLMFGLMALLSISAATLLLMIRTRDEPVEHEHDHEAAASVWSQITAGARWAVETRWPLAVIGISSILFIFMHPYEGVMIPLIVIEELGEDRSWVGYMVAIGGVGATVGSVAIAGMNEIRSPNALMIGVILVGGAMVAVLSQAPHLAVVAICAFFGSACTNNMVAVANLSLLAHAPQRLRGQALTLMNLVLGTSLIGSLIAGMLAETLGPRWGLLTMGACLLACALLALSTPRVRWWLWRRSMYVDVSREEWLRGGQND